MRLLKRVTCWMFGHYWCFTVKYADDVLRDYCGICEARRTKAGKRG